MIAGLSLPQKALPPKYFYDDAGSRLFERICRLREYYLTRAELALTRKNIGAIARFAGRGCELIEYGSGESLKTRLLIRALRPAAYLPVDISRAALRDAAERLGREFPWLEIVPVNGDFSRPVELPRSRAPRVVYFPGSTIGNLSPEEAHAFLSMTRGCPFLSQANILLPLRTLRTRPAAQPACMVVPTWQLQTISCNCQSESSTRQFRKNGYGIEIGFFIWAPR